MAFKNFIPQIWSTKIEEERDNLLVASKLCNRQYEGEIKQVGDKVKINGVSRPTISDYDDVTGLGEMERPKDQSTLLEITEQKAFHFYVGDIDQRQSMGDVMAAEKKEAAAGLAEVMDSFIYSHYKEAGITTTVNSLTASNVMSTISGVLAKLWKNKVPRNEKISLEATPEFIEKLLLANVLLNTDNSQIITTGIVGTLKLFNVDVYMSTNIHSDSTNGDCIFVRTNKAIAMADALKEVKAYEPANYFGEAVKGLQVYGAKVVRPSELAVIKVKSYGEEKNI
ncbi:MAG: hypothetical protein IJF30_00785 [Clostridia bacterium]|nr:hypothetical protein [Clostridia bacterium]MBQ9997531.1 hypothetical protein [Clostridia bacterium]